MGHGHELNELAKTVPSSTAQDETVNQISLQSAKWFLRFRDQFIHHVKNHLQNTEVENILL